MEKDIFLAAAHLSKLTLEEKPFETEEEEGVTESGALASSTAELNPLENVVILNHFFKLCPPELLATCRLVCKQWHEESLEVWRTTALLTFSTEAEQIVLRNRISQPQIVHTSFDKFLDFLDDPRNKCTTKPYRIITVDNWDSSDPRKSNLLFWNAMGSNITNLTLHQIRFTDTEELRKVLFTACPKLQCILMQKCVFPSQDSSMESDSTVVPEYKEPLCGKQGNLKTFEICDSDPLPLSWLELFAHFQSMTIFAMSPSPTRQNCAAEFRNMTNAIRLIRKHDPTALPFTSFKNSGWINISECDPIFGVLLLPIQEICITITLQSPMDENVFKEFIELHGEAVTKMDLTQRDMDSLLQQFPFERQLNNLRELYRTDVQLPSLTFLKHTPSLECLYIIFDYRESFERSEIVSNTELAQVRMPKLGSFTLRSIVTDEDLGRLVEWMPNLKHLDLLLNDKQFQFVCENWTNLSRLSVHGHQLTDEGLRAGIHSDIGNVKSLNEFEFCSSQLTALSVFHGFLQLPQLTEITAWINPLLWGEEEREALKINKIVLQEEINCGLC